MTERTDGVYVEALANTCTESGSGQRDGEESAALSSLGWSYRKGKFLEVTVRKELQLMLLFVCGVLKVQCVFSTHCAQNED